MYIIIKIYFLLFLIYANLGWMLEVTGKLIERKKFINRGFLLGPYCPIYGFGALLITILLKKYLDMPIILFIMAIILCGILEYSTSFCMEKIFHLRWWDYSQRKFNLHGRICLRTIIPFGILGTIIMYILNPIFLDKILYQMSNNAINICFYSFASIFLIDNIISFTTILGIRNTTFKISKENIHDNTEEITKKVKEILLNRSFIQRRLLNAYPKLEIIKLKIKERIEETKDEIEKTKEVIDQKVNKAKNDIKKTRKKIWKK